MALIVQKFGGTSLGSCERIERAAERVVAARAEGHDVVVVCSAMGDETDRLVGLADTIARSPDARELDTLLASGEQASVALLAMALIQRGCAARSWLGSRVRILTEDVHGKARIQGVETEGLRRDLADGIVPVIAGFQGVNASGDITTLGRGGSDTTAVAVAVALGASECQILTDVDGVYTTDPRLVPEAQLMRRITFEEMLEMASLGSRILQIRAVEFAGKHDLPLRVAPAAHDGPGTLISYEEPGLEAPLVAGIAFTTDEAAITITRVPHRSGMAHQILAPVAAAQIDVDMIVLNGAAEGCVDMSFSVQRADFDAACDVVRPVALGLPGSEIRGANNVVKLSVVGVGMRSHAGVATRVFEALAQHRINVHMVSTSEIKISVLVDEEHLQTGVRCLHEAFGLAESAAGSPKAAQPA